MRALVLASASPRRRELLAGLGLRFEILSPSIPEAPGPGEAPDRYVARLAVEKARVVGRLRPEAVIVSADTEVVLDGVPLGKPVDADDARRMLRRLAGRAHEVWSGVCVRDREQEAVRTVCTRVELRPLGDAELDWYVGTGEPLDKAGAYGIQGRAGMFVRAIEGSASNVIGLPLAETVELLDAAGVALPWSASARGDGG